MPRGKYNRKPKEKVPASIKTQKFNEPIKKELTGSAQTAREAIESGTIGPIYSKIEKAELETAIEAAQNKALDSSPIRFRVAVVANEFHFESEALPSWRRDQIVHELTHLFTNLNVEEFNLTVEKVTDQ